ncbi:MAG: presenilin family intramembrane aspartyl protease PSH [Halobacteria archaeon]|nr:presenilin family intramembrane aspartyl protease PSH [Halobacteria archaeon]
MSETAEPPEFTGVKDYLPFVFMALLFLVVEVLAVALTPSFKQAGLQATKNPQDPTNSIIYVVFILVFTLFLLAALKYSFDWIIEVFVLLSASALVYYVLSVFFPFAVAVALALGLAVLIYVYPEWYVLDVGGVLMGAGGAGIFGISFGILPSLVLLVVLAVYDAVAVYRTKHMLTLADGVMDMKLPIMFVIPRSLDYSFIEEGEKVEVEDREEESEESERDDEAESEEARSGEDEGDRETEAELQERDAFFMGLGDAVIPSVLIASAAHFLGTNYGVALVENYAVLGAVMGSFVGFTVLMYQVSKGKPQAGLPLLNGGTILGFVIGGLALDIPLIKLVGL